MQNLSCDNVFHLYFQRRAKQSKTHFHVKYFAQLGGGLLNHKKIKEKSKSEEEPSGQAKQPPPPNPLAQGLNLPLAIRCLNKITFRKISIC